VVNIAAGDGNYNLPNLGRLLQMVCEKTKVYLFLANNISALKKVEYRQKPELKANLNWY